MAEQTYKLKTGRTCRIKLGDYDIPVLPGQLVDIDFADSDQAAAVTASDGKSSADFDVVVDSGGHHKIH